MQISSKFKENKSFQQLLKEQALRERLASEDREGLWSLLPTEGETDNGAHSDQPENK